MTKSGNRYGPQFVIETILTPYIENSVLHMDIVMSKQHSEWVFYPLIIIRLFALCHSKHLTQIALLYLRFLRF